MLHRLLIYLASHIEDFKLVAKFLGGLAASFGAVVGGVIAWRKLAHERKQGDLRIVRPTMEEIEKYGQPIRSPQADRKIGGILTIIIGVAYTYILLGYMHGTSAPAMPTVAVVVFNIVGILAVMQGLFHPLGQISISMSNRFALIASGVVGIGAGTFVGVSAAPHPIPAEVLSPIFSSRRSPEFSGGTFRAYRDKTACREMSSSCIALTVEERDGLGLAQIVLSDVFGAQLNRSPKEITLWIKGASSHQRVEFTTFCYEKEPPHRIHGLWGFLPADWEEVSINWIVTDCATFEPDPSLTIFVSDDHGAKQEQTIFLDRGRISY
jgi:hypothetical protein